MLIPRGRLFDAYTQLRDRARCERSAVMILVAGECDAIAACHIFTSFLRSDNITFSLKPVNCYQDVIDALLSLDQDSYKSVVCFNCGACINLEDRLGFSEEQWERMKLYILDSHRPIHVNNVHFDRQPVEGSYDQPIFDDESLENAKVIVVDGYDELSDMIPSFEDMLYYEEDFDDYDEADDIPPAQRRRLGEGEEDNDDEQVRQMERETRKKKRQANLIIDQYSSRASRSRATAFLMFQLATALRKDTNELLWWAIIGLTEQHVNGSIARSDYESELRLVTEEVARLNPEDARLAGNMSRIAFVQDYKFMLLRYWTLYDSMYHSDYIASKLELWKDQKHDSNQLRTLLAKMGIAKTEAEQKYFSMKASIQDELKGKLEYWAPTFKIEEYQFDTFHKIRHIAHHISAADCVHITSAMLNYPPSAKEKWADGFYRAYDAIQWCASREDKWDQIVSGNSTAIQCAIEIQKAIIQRAFDTLFPSVHPSKRSHVLKLASKIGGLRKLCFKVNESNSLIAQPMTLKKIAQFIAQNQSRTKSSKLFRMVIGVEDTTTGKCTVVGVEGPSSNGFQVKNQFGKAFQMAAKDVRGIEIHQDLFDSEILLFSRCSFEDFAASVNSAFERLHDRDLYISRMEQEQDEEGVIAA